MSVTGFVLRSGGKIRSTIVDIRSTIVDIRIFWSGGAVGAGQTLVAAAQQPANLLKKGDNIVQGYGQKISLESAILDFPGRNLQQTV